MRGVSPSDFVERDLGRWWWWWGESSIPPAWVEETEKEDGDVEKAWEDGGGLDRGMELL